MSRLTCKLCGATAGSLGLLSRHRHLHHPEVARLQASKAGKAANAKRYGKKRVEQAQPIPPSDHDIVALLKVRIDALQYAPDTLAAHQRRDKLPQSVQWHDSMPQD